MKSVNQTFIVWSQRVWSFHADLFDPVRDPMLPIGIRFEPTRSHYPEDRNLWVKPIAMYLDGHENGASSADIGCLTGKLFWDSDARRIPLVRLKLWLAGLLVGEDIFDARTPDLIRKIDTGALRQALGEELFKWQLDHYAESE